MSAGRPDATLAYVPSTNHSFGLEPARTAPAALRARLTDLVGDQIGRDALARLQLVGTELVNNAVVHGDGEITVTVAVTDERVRLDVADHGSGAPEVGVREGGEHGGWGLQIVNRLSSRWGVIEGTTHVWCEIALPVAA
jgi:anti-sigma regulatory factor (Ser/Thr protein kinase)